MNLAHTPQCRDRLNSRTDPWSAPTAALQPLSRSLPSPGARSGRSGDRRHRQLGVPGVEIALPRPGGPRGLSGSRSTPVSPSLRSETQVTRQLERCFSPSRLPRVRITHPPPGTRSARPRQRGEPGSSLARRLPEGNLSLSPSSVCPAPSTARAAAGSPGRSPARTPRCPSPAHLAAASPRSGCGGRSSVRGRGNHPRGSGHSSRRSGCQEDAPHRLPHVAAQRPKWLWNSPPTPPPPQSLGRKHGVRASASLPARRSILPWLPAVPDPSGSAEPELLGRAALSSLLPSLRTGQNDRAAFRRHSPRQPGV